MIIRSNIGSLRSHLQLIIKHIYKRLRYHRKTIDYNSRMCKRLENDFNNLKHKYEKDLATWQLAGHILTANELATLLAKQSDLDNKIWEAFIFFEKRLQVLEKNVRQ